MGIKKNWFFPNISSIYCYRVFLFFLFLISLPVIRGLKTLFFIRILIGVTVLLILDSLTRKIVIPKFSPALMYIFTMIIPSAVAGITSANSLLNTTEFNFFNLLKGYFAFINYLSALPDILVLIGVLGGGLMVAPVFEKIFKNSMTSEKIDFILNKDVKLALVLLFTITFYLYFGNWNQTYFTCYGILNTIYPDKAFGIWKKILTNSDK